MKPLPTVEALRTISAIGYDGVELALMPGWPADPANLTAADRKQIVKTLEDTGLALPALNENLQLTATPQSRARNLERLKLAAEMAHQLSPAGRWRIARVLVADLLCLWLPPGDVPGLTMDAVMAQLGHAMAAQLARARGQTVPAPPGRFGAGAREA